MGPPPEGTSVPRPLPPLGEAELEETLRRAVAGDAEARERLIQSHLRLVWDIVRRFSGAGLDRDDLFQLGCLGLVKALDGFDPSFGTRFSTYAVPLIIGEIKRFLRDDGPVHVSRRAKEIAREARRVEEELTKSTGRVPTAAEVAGSMGLDATEVAESLEASRAPVSLYQETAGEGDDALYLIDQLAAGHDGSGSTLFGQARAAGPDDGRLLDSVALREVLARLDERTRDLLVLRFFDDKTQAEVGEVLGISQVQVSRLEKQALLRLRAMLSPD